MRVCHCEPGVVDDRANVRDVVVETLQFQQNHAQQPGPRRNVGTRRRLDGLTIRKRMADTGVAGHAFGKFHAVERLPPFEELLGAFVREIQTGFHVDDRLAHHAESKVPGLDHARVYRADRDFIDTLAAHRGKWKRLAVIAERSGDGILPQRIVALGPESVFDEWTRIRVSRYGDAKLIPHLALES